MAYSTQRQNPPSAAIKAIGEREGGRFLRRWSGPCIASWLRDAGLPAAEPTAPQETAPLPGACPPHDKAQRQALATQGADLPRDAHPPQHADPPEQDAVRHEAAPPRPVTAKLPHDGALAHDGAMAHPPVAPTGIDPPRQAPKLVGSGLPTALNTSA